MLRLESIMSTINSKLRNEFNIDINENDISKGFERPSFFVQFDNIYRTDYLFTFERSITVRIYYFPSDRYKYQIEALNIMQKLEDLFKLGFDVEDRHLSIVDIESEIVDGVLQVSFELKYHDSSYEEFENEKMGELNLDV